MYYVTGTHDKTRLRVTRDNHGSFCIGSNTNYFCTRQNCTKYACFQIPPIPYITFYKVVFYTSSCQFPCVSVIWRFHTSTNSGVFQHFTVVIYNNSNSPFFECFFLPVGTNTETTERDIISYFSSKKHTWVHIFVRMALWF